MACIHFFHSAWSFFLRLKHIVIFLIPFCTTDPNYTPQMNQERLRLKPNTSSLSVWHSLSMPMHLNYILTIPACIRGLGVRKEKGCACNLCHASTSQIALKKFEFHETSGEEKRNIRLNFGCLKMKGLSSHSRRTWNEVKKLHSATIEWKWRRGALLIE